MVLPVTLQNSSGTHAGIGNIMRPQVSTDPGRSRAKPNTVTIDRASDLRWSGSDVLTRHRATKPEHDKKAERDNLRLGSQPDQQATPAARSTRTACDDLRFVTRQSLSRTIIGITGTSADKTDISSIMPVRGNFISVTLFVQASAFANQ